MSDPLAILAVLCGLVAASEWIARRTVARHLGTALIVIVATAVVANLGIIPTGTTPPPLYEGVFAHVAYVAMFLLLLDVNLARVRRAGVPMLVLFALGAAGTVLGVVVARQVVGADAFGAWTPVLGGMFAATYTGGSLNFNAVALAHGFVEEGTLYTGAVAVDAIMTTLWMIATIAVPRGLAALARGRPAARAPRDVDDGIAHDTEAVHPVDAAMLLALATAALSASRALSAATAAWTADGSGVPAVLFLTTFALIGAHVPAVARLSGARVLGMFGVYLFLAVIGAYCDLRALLSIGALGGTLLAFVAVAVLVHGLVVFGGAALLRLDRDVAAVASQANIGGGTSALALARSLGRPDLVLPGILAGSLGTASGTYLGFLTVGILS